MQETEDRQREDYHEFVKVCTQVQERQYVDASVGDFYKWGNLRIKTKNPKANSQKNAFEYEWI